MRCVLKSPDPGAEPSADAAAELAELAECTARDLRELAGEPISRLPQLLEAMAAVGSDHDLPRALTRVAETAAVLTGARYAVIAVPSPDGDGIGDQTTHGVSPGPEGWPPRGACLEVPITFHGEVFGSLRVAGKQGAEVPGAAPCGGFGEADLHLVRVLATEAGIAMGNARMQAAARQRTHWIDGSASVTTALLAGPESTAEDALTVVARKGRELAEAATGAVLLPHAEGGMEVVTISTELSDAVRSEAFRGRIPAQSPVLHQINAGQAVFADDFASDPRSVSSLGTQFAAQAALALVLADRHRDRERLAVYEDRDRIARDLHDLVIQRLFATGMLLESARRKSLVQEVQEVQESVGQAVDELDATIQEIRTAIIALRQGPPEAPPRLRTRVCERPAPRPRRSAAARPYSASARSTPVSTRRLDGSCWPRSARRWRRTDRPVPRPVAKSVPRSSWTSPPPSPTAAPPCD